MSAIIGLFHLDGRPISREVLEQALVVMSDYGPDRSGLWADGSIGLGHLMLFITPESQREMLPYNSEGFTITADARIDNRHELFNQLSIPLPNRSHLPDSHLILEAYKKWGKNCPAKLIGEFTFAVWDDRNQELFCACDHMGIRPFYYFRSQQFIAFATDVRGLWALPGVPKALHEFEVVKYLAGSLPFSQHQTLYQGIKKLPFGQHLTINRNGFQIRKYWFPFNQEKIRLSSEKEYIKKLRELMEEAVSCRLRTTFPVASHVTGGLDSSSIAVLAARKLRQQGRQLNIGYSWSPPKCSEYPPKKIDERDRIERLCQKNRIPVHSILAKQNDWYEFLYRFPWVGSPRNYLYEKRVLKHASQFNVRTILTGLGGDQGITMRGHGYLSELLCRGRALKLAKQYLGEFGIGPKGVLQKTFYPLLPDSLFKPFDHRNKKSVEAFIHPAWEKKYSSKIKLSSKHFREHIGLHTQQRFRLELGDLTMCANEWRIWSAPHRLIHTYPLLDRRVLEFAFRIPSDLYVKKGLRAYVYRMAMKDVLPSEYIYHQLKVDPVLQHLKETKLGGVIKRIADEIKRGEWNNINIPYVNIAAFKKKILSFPLNQWKTSHHYQMGLLLAVLEVKNLWQYMKKD